MLIYFNGLAPYLYPSVCKGGLVIRLPMTWYLRVQDSASNQLENIPFVSEGTPAAGIEEYDLTTCLSGLGQGSYTVWIGNQAMVVFFMYVTRDQVNGGLLISVEANDPRGIKSLSFKISDPDFKAQTVVKTPIQERERIKPVIVPSRWEKI